MSTLPASLQSFADAGPDLDAARALKGGDEADLLALIAALAADGKRAHLETLANAGLGKAVKKAAGTAAYKLKSKGVAGEVRKSGSFTMATPEVSLDRVAIVGAPGLDGQVWLVLADLGGVAGGELEIRDPETPARAEVHEDLSKSRLRKHLETSGSARPVLAHADLAVRVIDTAKDALRQHPGGAPPAFDHLLRWRDRAVELGADPARADSRAQLGAEVPGEIPEAALTDLLGDPRVAFLTPPRATIDAIEDRMGPLLHDPEEIDEAAFRARVDGELDAVADALFERDGVKEQLARWLEADADVLYSVGAKDRALGALACADACRAFEGKGSAWPPLGRLLREVLSYDAAWSHRQAHIAGTAHHDH